MTYVVLDIGAGSRAFAKELCSKNRWLQMSVLCGEPYWGPLSFLSVARPSKVSSLLATHKRGIWRVHASFGNFMLPDESLDLVTMNAANPMDFMSASKVHLELSRCLRPGGLFFSSFPAYPVGTIPKDFVCIGRGDWKHDPQEVTIPRHMLPKGAPSVFPQSRVIRSNIRLHRNGLHRTQPSGYLYKDGISPGWELWQKPEIQES